MTEYGAIPTKYKGLQFRSRLEAQWAAFFDLLGWKWEYEPFDLNGYIPDFILKFKHRNILVEIKPDIVFKDLKKYEKKIKDSGYEGQYLICGSTLFPFGDKDDEPYSYVKLGLFGPEEPQCRSVKLVNDSYIDSESDDDNFYYDSDVIITICYVCKRISLCSEDRDWICYVCGEQGKYARGEIFMEDIEPLWYKAKNMVQYKPNTKISEEENEVWCCEKCKKEFELKIDLLKHEAKYYKEDCNKN